MKVLLDTNVVLDVLLARGPWNVAADKIWQAALASQLECCLSATALTDLYYIARRLVGTDDARKMVRSCLDVLTMVPVDDAMLEAAYAMTIDDFEDGVQIACAARENVDAIVTRDTNGFKASTVPALIPDALIALLTTGPQAP